VVYFLTGVFQIVVLGFQVSIKFSKNSVELCVFSVKLKKNYTEAHREDTEVHREKNTKKCMIFNIRWLQNYVIG